MKIDYTPTVKQKKIHKALTPWFSGKEIFVVAGRRFGKTLCSINEIVKRAIELPGIRIWYVTNTKEQAYDIAWPMMIEGWRDKNGKIHPPFLPKECREKVRMDKHWVKLRNKSWVQFKGLQDELFILGVGLGFVVLDEFPAIPWSAWYDTIRPMLADSNGDALFIGTVPDPWVHNITPEFLEMYEEYLINPTKNRRAFNFSSFDNPHINHKKVQQDIDDLKHKGREADAERLYYGKYTRGVGKIFPKFDYKTHTVEPIKIPANWTRIMALDPHPQKPYVAVWAAISPTNHFWFYREMEFKEADGRPLTIQETAYEILEMENNAKEKIRRRFIDPTYAKIQQNILNQKTVKDVLRDYGLHFVEADRSFDLFYNKFGDMLVEEPEPTVHIFRPCINCVRQIGNAVWDTYASGRARSERGPKDRPKKTDDDYRDCMKYIINANVQHVDMKQVNAFRDNLKQRWANRQYL